MKSAEELAKEYISTLSLGGYGREYDAFIAGYIACLENWEWHKEIRDERKDEENKS